MPSYLYRCTGCEDESIFVMTIAMHDERGKSLRCELCEGRLVQVLGANIDKSSLK